MSYFLFGLARTCRAAGNRHLVPRTVVQTIVSTPLFPQSHTVPAPAASNSNSRSYPRSRDSIANHRAGLTLMKASRSIDFDGTLVPLFFPTSLFRCPGFPQLSRFIPHNQQRSFSPSLSFCDELAELTGCEPVVQKHANI